MPEAKPDPSGSTGEFRAFVEKGGADSVRRAGLRSPAAAVIIAAVLAVLVVILVLAVAVR